jgi:hypothetical protein
MLIRCRRCGDCNGSHAAVAVAHVADDAGEVVAAGHSNCATLDGEEAAPVDDARSAGAVTEDHEAAAAAHAALSSSLKLEISLLWMKHTV